MQTEVEIESPFLTSAKKVLAIEAKAIEALIPILDENFIKACQKIMACKGRIIVTGMGKSGHIARKIAATLSSTGTPAFFLHPAEAQHGDLGMITAHDLVLGFSHSGKTEELAFILPFIKRLGAYLITCTSNATSTLARKADLHLLVPIKQEACPLGLAPTASTTAALALGDALAISILETKGFTTKDFARSHPGGTLGRQLLLTVDDIMVKGLKIPKVTEDTSFSDTLMEMSEKRLGMTTIVLRENPNKVIGIFTDGDLRRTLERKDIDIYNTTISKMMTQNFKSIQQGQLATEALHTMQSHKIMALPVLDKNDDLIGALNFQDLLQAGVY